MWDVVEVYGFASETATEFNSAPRRVHAVNSFAMMLR